MTRRAGAPRHRARSRKDPSFPRQPQVLTANTQLYRNSAWLFAVFAAGVLIAFWPSYYSRLGSQASFHAHAHGLAMTLWCALLVTQGWLIRSGNRARHRQIGVLSFVLVPLIVLTTVNFLHFRAQDVQRLDSGALGTFALVLNALVAFVLIYGLGIAFRRQPPIHARYMLSTIFPLFTPVTDRLIGRHAPSLIGLVPRIDGTPLVPVAGFLLADVMLVALSVWDWRANRRLVFPIALAILLVYHWSVLTFHGFPAWRRFGEWFVTLPLS